MRKDAKIILDEILPFSNEQYEGVILRWYGDIGFGEYTIHRAKGETKWKADSEHMDSEEDKSFLKELLRQMTNMLVIED